MSNYTYYPGMTKGEEFVAGFQRGVEWTTNINHKVLTGQPLETSEKVYLGSVLAYKVVVGFLVGRSIVRHYRNKK